jgi:succinyl-diaminopimelate desuccinylase
MDTPDAIDALGVTRALIRCPSVTPAEGGAIALLQRILQGRGFTCHRLRFESPGEPAIDNLYARMGEGRPNFCFAGHSDVVPAGDRAAWTADPFGAEVRDGALYGRGAADMKSAIACFIAAAAGFIDARRGKLPGSISLLITGDEEGRAVNGTVKVLEWMKARGEAIDACVVGEPTNPERLGDMIKIGRRGSLHGHLRVRGVQGHVGYPHLADNPIPRIGRMLVALAEGELDKGDEHFQPSTLAITTVDVGNKASNVIPGEARASFNIRFNTRQTPESLEAWVRKRLDGAGGAYELRMELSALPFLCEPGALSEALAAAVSEVTGRTPELSTSGGTSDARFIRAHCPVAEFGMVGQTMHKVDERVAVADIETLTRIYRGAIERFFAAR